MIRVNHIRLRSITSKHTFGTDIPLSGGLNIIQADNTSGKSTCLQAIIYGLGLERSLGPGLEVPLPPAMRERIQQVKDGDYESVLESYVMLELSNSKGDVVTLRRDIVGGAERKLVQTWAGRTLDGLSQSGEQRDFFLHDAGAAVRSDGFHAYLSSFIGWELPDVPRFDGSECPLYLETLFPMFFVEQKRGWSITQGPFPTYLGIQDLSRRVMEFLLDLDAGKIRRRKAELRKQISHIEQRWKDKRTDLVDGAGGQVRVSGLPQLPNVEFSRGGDVSLSVFYRDKWASIEEVSSSVLRRIEDVDSTELLNADEAQLQIKGKLEAAELRNIELLSFLTLLRQDYQAVLTEKQSLEDRIAALEVDLYRNLDADKLKRLGSALGQAASQGSCPTCHQPTSRELLPEVDVKGMGIEENIAFIRSQLDLYRSMLSTCEGRINSFRIRYRSLEEEATDVRAAIRGFKNDLLRPASVPIRSELEELVRLQSRLDYWNSLQESIDGSLDELRAIAAEWASLSGEHKGLGSGDLNFNDKRKIQAMQMNMQGLLKTFGFHSFKSEEISLSDDNFRPQVVKIDDEGNRYERDIGFEASASDGIRLKWAYYLSLIELAKNFDINHLGFVVFDEPGQQQMKDVDLSTFFGWSAKNIGPDQQMIVSTSESIAKVLAALGSARANVRAFDSFILRPI